MKPSRNYQEHEVVYSLNKKHDVKVSGTHKQVFLLHGHQAVGDLGNKSKGKIDFLRKYCGYSVMWTDKF